LESERISLEKEYNSFSAEDKKIVDKTLIEYVKFKQNYQQFTLFLKTSITVPKQFLSLFGEVEKDIRTERQNNTKFASLFKIPAPTTTTTNTTTNTTTTATTTATTNATTNTTTTTTATPTSHRICRTCKETLPKDSFSKSQWLKGSDQSNCKSCVVLSEAGLSTQTQTITTAITAATTTTTTTTSTTTTSTKIENSQTPSLKFFSRKLYIM